MIYINIYIIMKKEVNKQERKNAWGFISFSGGKEATSDEVLIKEIDECIQFGTNEKKKQLLDLVNAMFGRGTYDPPSDKVKEAIERLKADIIAQNLSDKRDEACSDRQIDFERLHNYFNRHFNVRNREALDNWVKDEHIPKEFAVLASEIYNCKYFISSNKHGFKQWYMNFCDIVKCKYIKSYHQSKLKPTLDQTASFYFLDVPL